MTSLPVFPDTFPSQLWLISSLYPLIRGKIEFEIKLDSWVGYLDCQKVNLREFTPNIKLKKGKFNMLSIIRYRLQSVKNRIVCNA